MSLSYNKQHAILGPLKKETYVASQFSSSLELNDQLLSHKGNLRKLDNGSESSPGSRKGGS